MNETYKQIVLAKYTECPYYGRPKLTAHLRQMGHHVNPKRRCRETKELGTKIQKGDLGLFFRPKTSFFCFEH